MTSKRDFLKMSFVGASTLGSAGALVNVLSGNKTQEKPTNNTIEVTQMVNKPIVVSTWEHGLAANEVAWQVLKQGEKLLMRLSRVYVYQKLTQRLEQ